MKRCVKVCRSDDDSDGGVRNTKTNGREKRPDQYPFGNPTMVLIGPTNQPPKLVVSMYWT